jgi:hypothetical protein
VEHDICVVSVTNPSRVSATPNGLGIKCRGGIDLLLITPSSISGGALTDDLAPGHQRIVRSNTRSLLQQIDGRECVRAFVSTQVGDVFTGSKKEMRAFLKELRAASERLDRTHGVLPVSSE